MSSSSASSPPPTLLWRNDCLELLDQTRLPNEVVVHLCADVPTVHEAIRTLRVRGAPAIGIAAAYGVCLGAKLSSNSLAEVRAAALAAADDLATSRPTAVNLFWALDRMRKVVRDFPATGSVDSFRQVLIDEAIRIHDEDRQMCHAIGKYGAELLADGSGVLTHCNAGGLATSEFGTALAAIYAAQAAGKRIQVYADETRPLLQGARLTAWELMQAGIPVTLICDSMAAQVMREGRVQAVIVGADRIAANGDVANKIGTYGVALLAAAHGIPFYVAAPSSTFDLTLETGDAIPIEQRAAEEITAGMGRVTAPVGVQVYNPAFDVTPAKLIAAIITEQGIVHQPTREKISQLGI